MAEDLILLLPWGEDPRANRGGAGSSPFPGRVPVDRFLAMDAMPMTPSAAYLILIDALMLARERVTADTLAEKQAKRDAIKAAVSGMHQWDDGEESAKPTAAQLRELLGDPDDHEIRRALEAWDDPAPHSD